MLPEGCEQYKRFNDTFGNFYWREIAMRILSFDALYGNFDIILDHFSHSSMLHNTPHAPCAVIYLVRMLSGF